jgi:hypothetical protein
VFVPECGKRQPDEGGELFAEDGEEVSVIVAQLSIPEIAEGLDISPEAANALVKASLRAKTTTG